MPPNDGMPGGPMPPTSFFAVSNQNILILQTLSFDACIFLDCLNICGTLSYSVLPILCMRLILIKKLVITQTVFVLILCQILSSAWKCCMFVLSILCSLVLKGFLNDPSHLHLIFTAIFFFLFLFCFSTFPNWSFQNLKNVIDD